MLESSAKYDLGIDAICTGIRAQNGLLGHPGPYARQSIGSNSETTETRDLKLKIREKTQARHIRARFRAAQKYPQVRRV